MPHGGPPTDRTAAGRFAGARAIVTGAGSGIGLAVTRRLIAEGARVAGLDRDAAGLERARAALAGAGTGASAGAGAGAGGAAEAFVPLSADVADEPAVEAAVGAAVQALGGAPTVLVQAAGIYRVRSLLETSGAEWDEVLGINVRGTFLVARAAVRTIAAAGGRCAIVNLASVAAYAGSSNEPSGAYNASKAAVVVLTKQMAVEWAPLGIRVNAVAPGVIATPMLRLMDDPAAGAAWLDAAVPLRRLGTADEVAATICFLASDEAAYTTGETVLVDGGLRAR